MLCEQLAYETNINMAILMLFLEHVKQIGLRRKLGWIFRVYAHVILSRQNCMLVRHNCFSAQGHIYIYILISISISFHIHIVAVFI